MGMKIPGTPASPAEIEEKMLAYLRETSGETAVNLLPELAQLYLEDTAKQITDVGSAVAANDAVKLRQAGHALKGSSAIMGFDRLAALAKEVERLGKEGQVQKAASLLPDLQNEYQPVQLVLRSYAAKNQ